MTRTAFLDLDFDALSEADAEAWLSKRSDESAFAYVVTPNVDHIVRLAESPPEIRQTYRDATLCLCDSRVLARLATLSGVTLSVVPGSDLVADLFSRVLKSGDTVCVIGVSAEDFAKLVDKYPAITFRHHSPPMGMQHDRGARAAAVTFAVDAGARFTLLAVGSPQQELVAWEMQQTGAASGTALCIGASIDFLIGTQSRAPKLIRRLGVEWGWRLLTQPRRLARRYLVDGPAIFPIVWRWRKAQRVRKV